VAVDSPRAASAEELSRRVPPAAGGLRRAENVREALEGILAGGNGDPIIVAGSLYLVGEARSFLLARNKIRLGHT
jgi:folylpolyglutamate synthase/dihydropteroate synthase